MAGTHRFLHRWPRRTIYYYYLHLESTMAKSVINADGSVDISRLEHEIREDLSLYRKHNAEDGMKKKAIHTSVDYDEFKNFVSAAELKPTTSRDVSSLFTGTVGSVSRGSNSAWLGKDVKQGDIGGYVQRRKDSANETKKVHGSNAKSNIEALSLPTVGSSINAQTTERRSSKPSNKSSREAYDFLLEWKQQCKSPKQTISFLTRTKAASDAVTKKEFIYDAAEICNTYFSTDIDSEILGDIVDGLHLLMQSERISRSDQLCYLDNIKSTGSSILEFIDSWLKSIAGCGRFGLSVSFLSSEQSRKLGEIVRTVKISSDESIAYFRPHIEHYEKLLR